MGDVHPSNSWVNAWYSATDTGVPNDNNHELLGWETETSVLSSAHSLEMKRIKRVNWRWHEHVQITALELWQSTLSSFREPLYSCTRNEQYKSSCCPISAKRSVSRSTKMSLSFQQLQKLLLFLGSPPRFWLQQQLCWSSVNKKLFTAAAAVAQILKSSLGGVAKECGVFFFFSDSLALEFQQQQQDKSLRSALSLLLLLLTFFHSQLLPLLLLLLAFVFWCDRRPFRRAPSDFGIFHRCPSSPPPAAAPCPGVNLWPTALTAAASCGFTTRDVKSPLKYLNSNTNKSHVEIKFH